MEKNDMSVRHQRRMQASGQNPNRKVTVMDQFMRLRRSFHGKNSSRGASQTEFVKHLGKTGKCKVDGDATSSLVFEDVESTTVVQKRKAAAAASDFGKRSRSASEEELMKEEERALEQSNWKDNWLCEGIVVTVMSEKGYYKQKGVVRKVIDRYVGEIEMLESKHVVRLDQKELKIVLPKIGGSVKIVNGAYRGSNARFLGINTDKFCPKVKIENGEYDGRVCEPSRVCELIAGDGHTWRWDKIDTWFEDDVAAAVNRIHLPFSRSKDKIVWGCF